MAQLDVPTPYPTIRAAISAAATDDQIYISAGTYDIRDAYNLGDLLGPPTFAYTTNLNCMTGFEQVLALVYSGDMNSTQYVPLTRVTGNARLFVNNQDSVAPMSLYFENIELVYNSASSNYILQTGKFGVSEDDTLTDYLTLSNLTYTGTHAGSAGANGNYMSVIGIQTFNMMDNVVKVTGQTSFIGTQAITGGSSFLMLQGGRGSGGADTLSVSQNIFDETGYRNGFSIFDSSNLFVGNNDFYREGNTRYARSRMVSGVETFNVGNKIANSGASITGNHFYDGSYLVLERTINDPTLTVDLSSNHFHQWDATKSPIPNPILGGGAVGITLQGSFVSSYIPNLGLGNNMFNYVAPFNNYSSTPTLITGGGNQYTNPANNSAASVNRYHVGGTGNDTLTGTTAAEVFNGGAGNDTINTGSGIGSGSIDFVIFNSPLSATTNVDTVTNFSYAANNAFIDRIVLDRKYFTGITAHYNNSATGVLGGVGAVSATNVENNTTGISNNPSTRLVYQTTTGNLYFDPDGSITPGNETLFARVFTSASSTVSPVPLATLVGFNSGAPNANAVNITII